MHQPQPLQRISPVISPEVLVHQQHRHVDNAVAPGQLRLTTKPDLSIACALVGSSYLLSLADSADQRDSPPGRCVNLSRAEQLGEELHLLRRTSPELSLALLKALVT